MEINFWDVIEVAILIMITGGAFVLAGGLAIAGTQIGRRLAVLLAVIGTITLSMSMTKFFFAGNGIPAQEDSLTKKINTTYQLLSLTPFNDRKTVVVTLLNKKNNLVEVYELSQPPPSRIFTVFYENGKIKLKPDSRKNTLKF